MASIKDLRKKLGITQQGLADLIGVPVGTVRNWEQGRNVPPVWAENLLIEKMEGRIKEKEESAKMTFTLRDHWYNDRGTLRTDMYLNEDASIRLELSQCHDFGRHRLSVYGKNEDDLYTLLFDILFSSGKRAEAFIKALTMEKIRRLYKEELEYRQDLELEDTRPVLSWVLDGTKAGI